MRSSIIAATVLVVSVGLAQAGVRADLSGDAVVDFATTMDMPFMAVGNPGNAADDTGFGAVDYAYNIGKFEVTAGQYTEFLNAVAADDTYGLYIGNMSFDTNCNIERAGSSGSYTYSVAADWEDRPVNFVSWGHSARFANWLTNGMPTGDQDLTTTEDGSYFLNGAVSDTSLRAVTREMDARYVIPNDYEWYKAAYHKNDGETGNYFEYPTSSDIRPSRDMTEAVSPGNNANYSDLDPDPYPIDPPHYTTLVGEFELSTSPYGTFDMGGNVLEWGETIEINHSSNRRLRGGSFKTDGYSLSVGSRFIINPAAAHEDLGFRIAEVPEPATLGLLALGGLAMVRRRTQQ